MHPPSTSSGKSPSDKPFEAIREFCISYHQHEAQSMLWDWLVTAVSRTNSIYDEGKERGSLFHLYEKISLLIAAAYSIHQHTEKSRTKPVSKKKPNRPDKP